MANIVEGDLIWPLADGANAFVQPAGLDTDLTALAEAVAVEWLWELSGRQFGIYSAVYRPQTRLLDNSGYGWDTPQFLQSIYGPLWGQGWPYDGDPRFNGLGVKQVLELIAPVVPPTDALPITVDIYDATTGAHTEYATNDTGTDLPAFRVEGDYLVRQDGGLWPETQNLIAALGTINTWAISYQRGFAVPPMGQVAAALLAVEFGKSFLGDAKCKIPYNAVTVSRAGVTINRNVLKASTTTGIQVADQWIAAVNPNGLMQPPIVWSPDVSRNARQYAGSYAPTQN